MRDSTIIQAFNSYTEQSNAAINEIRQTRELDAQIFRHFLGLPLRERLGWLLFGSRWLTRKAKA